MRPWMNITKAAAYAGVTRQTMSKWLDDGLKHSRMNKLVRIHPDNIDEYLQRYECSSDVEQIVHKALEGIV